MADTLTKRVNVRLDEETYAVLEAIKQQRRWKTSEAVRVAIRELARAYGIPEPPPPTAARQ
jgi:hypothetical protein